MADLSQTAANVRPGSGATVQPFTAGATITAGQVLYQDSADNKVKLADTTSAAKAAAIGIAITNASTDEVVYVLTEGDIDVGATLAVGEVYAVSDTAGAIRPDSDNGTGDYCTTLGRASTASNLKFKKDVSGIAHA